MYFNGTSGLWERWGEGEYYDKTGDVWRSWSGRCNELWMYQGFWFDWPVGEKFDLDKLKWEVEWDANMEVIESSRLRISSVWRSHEYYLDPFSERLIELGTKEYPYKSMLSISYEILNFFSNSNVNITIYVKNAYVEDDLLNFFNLSSVTITSYPEVIEKGRRSILIPTSIKQPSIINRTLYSLISINDETDLRHEYSSKISDIISSGNFTDSESNLLTLEKVSIMAVKTGFIFKNIDVYREEINPERNQIFLLPINLQNQNIKISKFFYFKI